MNSAPFMKNHSFHVPVALSLNILLLGILACNLLTLGRPIPTPAPPTPTATPIPVSAQVTLVSQALRETNQTPPFAITAQIPQLAGSDDPRVSALNQRLNELIQKEVDVWRGSFLQNTVTVNGSTLDETYTLISQMGDLWSLKLDFRFYSDGAAHPGLYSLTLNYDLDQGRELALGDLFIPNSNYLEVIADYCNTELSRQPGFEGPFTDGAKPTLENYKNWNITPEGLLITFEMYQVLPGASGPQQVLVPYSQLKEVLDPQGALAGLIQ